MKDKFTFSILLLTTLVAAASCCASRRSANQQEKGVSIPGAQTIIYITKGDYANLVPVTLTSDRRGIASYPDIKDVYFQGKLSYPTPLHKGYLLDNRGISENVAFIKLTYEEYAALPGTPTAEELMNMIVDKKPIKKMYVCGLRNRYVNITDELNAAIDAGNFTGFKRLK